MNISQEAGRRRTFAIISHPDAGKTTITEKILFNGGVIREAGEVKGKAGKKACLLYTSPSPRDATLSRMPSSA